MTTDHKKALQRERTKRYRDKQKGVTSGSVTPNSVTLQAMRDAHDGKVTTCASVDELMAELERPDNYGLLECTCMHCQSHRANNSKGVINHGPWKDESELGEREINRVTLPGDRDYVGVGSGRSGEGDMG